MSLIVETGEGNALSEAYASVADASAYILIYLPNDTTWSAATEAAQENALRIATMFLDNEWRSRWKGTRTNALQALAHPRQGMQDCDGFDIASDSIHLSVQRACIEAAARVVAGTELEADIVATDLGVESVSEKFDVFAQTIKYVGARGVKPVYSRIKSLLKDVVKIGGMVDRG